MENIFYTELAKLYDERYKDKDYKAEAEALEKVIRKFKETDNRKLLDVGCGTGNHINHLIDRFACTGLDLNNELLEVAREKVPEADFVQGDMKDFDLDKNFGAITCLFNSICCATTNPELQEIINNFVQHLVPGGVVLIQKTLKEEIRASPTSKDSFVNTIEGDDIKAARAGIWERKDNLLIRKEQFLIVKEDDVKHREHVIESGIFTDEELIDRMEEAGLDARLIEDNLGKKVFVGKIST